jgi:hypothetical protein
VGRGGGRRLGGAADRQPCLRDCARLRRLGAAAQGQPRLRKGLCGWALLRCRFKA